MQKKILILVGIITALIIIAGALFLFYRNNNRNQGANTEITAEQAISSFSAEATQASFARLDYLILQSEKHAEAAREAEKYLQDEDAHKRFAAIYLLTLTGSAENISALTKALDDQDQRYALLAAGTLIGWGEKNAIPVLIEALTSRETIPYSDPPTPLAQLAYQALPFYTGQDFGLSKATTEEELNNAQAEWKMWWSSNNEKLHWDKQTKKYYLQ